MQAIFTPLGTGMPETRVLTQAPQWSRHERGGWTDATVSGSFPDHERLLFASVVIQGEGGVRYMGRVAKTSSSAILCEGEQARLADTKHGRVYISTGADGWVFAKQRRDSISHGVNDAGALTATWNGDATYAALSDMWWVFTFPEPVDNPRVVLATTGLTTTYLAILYYGTDWAEDTWTSAASFTTNAGYDERINANGVTSLRLLVQNVTAVTPASDKTVTITPTIYGTSVDVANIGNLAEHVLEQGPLPLSDVSAISQTITALRLGAQATDQDYIAELLKYGDWRFYVTARLEGGAYKACGVFAPRPTTARYKLNEGAGVTFNPSQICAPAVSVVRAHYTDALQRPRYADATDTDEAHPLVRAVALGRATHRYADMDVDTTSGTDALAVATRAGKDMFRTQIQGQVVVTGSPGGVLAADYEPGELLELGTREYGTLVVRITESRCVGEHAAVLTVDNAPTFTDYTRTQNKSLAARWGAITRSLRTR